MQILEGPVLLSTLWSYSMAVWFVEGAECGNQRVIVTYYLCWQCAGSRRVIWPIYTALCKNKEMTNKYAEGGGGVHCFSTHFFAKSLLWPLQRGSLDSAKLSVTQQTRLHNLPSWPRHLVFLFSLKAGVVLRQPKLSVEGILNARTPPTQTHTHEYTRTLYTDTLNRYKHRHVSLAHYSVFIPLSFVDRVNSKL